MILRILGSEYTFTTITEIEERDLNYLLDMEQYVSIKEDLDQDMKEQEAKLANKR